jgi:hypothetical protein
MMAVGGGGYGFFFAAAMMSSSCRHSRMRRLSMAKTAMVVSIDMYLWYFKR